MSEGAVFSIFSIPELAKVVFGRKPGGIMAYVFDLPPSTAYRLAESRNSGALMDRLLLSGNEELRRLIEDVRSGYFPFPSTAAYIFYLSIRDVWRDYERSFQLLNFTERLELGARLKFGRLATDDLIDIILGLEPSDAQEVVFPEPDSHLFPITAEFEAFLRDERSQVVQDFFFELMAALDIDLYASLFGSYMPKMLFTAIFPDLVEDVAKPYFNRPLRRLLDLCYCSIMEVDEAPGLIKMIGPHVPNMCDSARGKLNLGSFNLNDFQILSRAWVQSRPDKVARLESQDESESQRQYGMLLILYFAARMLERVFESARLREDYPRLLDAFRTRYYRAWRRELARRGMSEAVGRPWDDRALTRILGNCYILE
jgi:hypothetical protein